MKWLEWLIDFLVDLFDKPRPKKRMSDLDKDFKEMHDFEAGKIKKLKRFKAA